MATIRRNNEFTDHVISRDNLLDEAIDWISKTLAPDEVFSDEDLKEHAAKAYNVDDVYSEKELSEWAQENGFTKE